MVDRMVSLPYVDGSNSAVDYVNAAPRGK